MLVDLLIVLALTSQPKPNVHTESNIPLEQCQAEVKAFLEHDFKDQKFKIATCGHNYEADGPKVSQ